MSSNIKYMLPNVSITVGWEVSKHFHELSSMVQRGVRLDSQESLTYKHKWSGHNSIMKEARNGKMNELF